MGGGVRQVDVFQDAQTAKQARRSRQQPANPELDWSRNWQPLANLENRCERRRRACMPGHARAAGGRAGCPAIWWKPEEAAEATDEHRNPPGPLLSLLRLAARACQGPTPQAGLLWGSPTL